ncbi:MAG: hypothetical protein WC732_09240 [Candidatus Omnitrophota bacterium]
MTTKSAPRPEDLPCCIRFVTDRAAAISSRQIDVLFDCANVDATPAEHNDAIGLAQNRRHSAITLIDTLLAATANRIRAPTDLPLGFRGVVRGEGMEDDVGYVFGLARAMIGARSAFLYLEQTARWAADVTCTRHMPPRYAGRDMYRELHASAAAYIASLSRFAARCRPAAVPPGAMTKAGYVAMHGYYEEQMQAAMAASVLIRAEITVRATSSTRYTKSSHGLRDVVCAVARVGARIIDMIEHFADGRAFETAAAVPPPLYSAASFGPQSGTELDVGGPTDVAPWTVVTPPFAGSRRMTHNDFVRKVVELFTINFLGIDVRAVAKTAAGDCERLIALPTIEWMIGVVSGDGNAPHFPQYAPREAGEADIERTEECMAREKLTQPATVLGEMLGLDALLHPDNPTRSIGLRDSRRDDLGALGAFGIVADEDSVHIRAVAAVCAAHSIVHVLRRAADRTAGATLPYKDALREALAAAIDPSNATNAERVARLILKTGVPAPVLPATPPRQRRHRRDPSPQIEPSTPSVPLHSSAEEEPRPLSTPPQIEPSTPSASLRASTEEEPRPSPPRSLDSAVAALTTPVVAALIPDVPIAATAPAAPAVATQARVLLELAAAAPEICPEPAALMPRPMPVRFVTRFPTFPGIEDAPADPVTYAVRRDVRILEDSKLVMVYV